jgi:hypothetical protein
VIDGAFCRYAHTDPSLSRFAPCIQLLIELPDGNTELLTVSVPPDCNASAIDIPHRSSHWTQCLTLFLCLSFPALCFLLFFFFSLRVQFRPDLTVGYVKVEIAKKHQIPFDCQELELDGKTMADPFSLSDYPALRSSRAANPARIIVKRVAPEDGEEEDDGAEEDGGPAPDVKDGPASDYDDESFDE